MNPDASTSVPSSPIQATSQVQWVVQMLVVEVEQQVPGKARVQQTAAHYLLQKLQLWVSHAPAKMVRMYSWMES